MGVYQTASRKLGGPATVIASVVGGTVVLALVFWLLLSLVYAIPTDLMKSNLLESYETLSAEGHYPTIYTNGKLYDNYAVAVMLNEAAAPVDGSPFIDSLRSMRFVPDEEGQIEALLKSINGETNSSYARYWHGYLVYLKPLLVFFDLRQIRMIFQAIFSLALFLASLLLCRELGKAGVVSAVFLVLSQSLFAGFDAAATLPIFASFTISLIGVSWVLLMRKRGSALLRAGFFVIGACTAYFDFLYNPILGLGMPLAVLVLAKYVDGESMMKSVGVFVSLCVMWVLGYGLLWVAKWALAMLLTGWDLVGDGMGAVAFRLGVDENSAAYNVSPLSAVSLNLSAIGWLRYVLALIAVVAIVMAIVVATRKRSSEKTGFIVCCILLVVVALIPYAWYVVVSNHSTIHVDFISYRNQLLTLFALGTMMAACTVQAQPALKRR